MGGLQVLDVRLLEMWFVIFFVFVYFVRKTNLT